MFKTTQQFVGNYSKGTGKPVESSEWKPYGIIKWSVPMGGQGDPIYLCKRKRTQVEAMAYAFPLLQPVPSVLP